MLFDPLKAFDKFESNHSDISYPKKTIFLHACGTCSKLSSNISTMISVDPDQGEERMCFNSEKGQTTQVTA